MCLRCGYYMITLSLYGSIVLHMNFATSVRDVYIFSMHIFSSYSVCHGCVAEGLRIILVCTCSCVRELLGVLVRAGGAKCSYVQRAHVRACVMLARA